MKKTKPRSKKSSKRAAKPAAKVKAKTQTKTKTKAQAAAQAKTKTKPKVPPARVAPERAAAKKPAKSAKPANKRSTSDGASIWLAFVEKHGVVLASARGPVPSIAEEIAREPIVGSWWTHPRAQVIFDTLSAIDDDVDVRCFKLVDKKVTFVHRRVWPALVRLARDGVLSPDRVASLQQEHMPTGEHRNLVTPFPEWVPDEVAQAADELSAEQARAQLGSWA